MHEWHIDGNFVGVFGFDGQARVAAVARSGFEALLVQVLWIGCFYCRLFCRLRVSAAKSGLPGAHHAGDGDRSVDPLFPDGLAGVFVPLGVHIVACHVG